MNDYMDFNHSRHTLIVCTLFVGGECGGDVRKNLIDVQNKFRRDEGGGIKYRKRYRQSREGSSRKVRCAVCGVSSHHLRRFVRAEEPPGPVSVVLRFGAGAWLVVADRRCCAVTSVLLLRRGSRGR
jgi:hypothetical protein